jgi:hypothetical protein
MNCREFEERWNEILDARSVGLPEIERDLEAHAARCESCQAISARFQVLRQAVAAWGPAPTLSADALLRIRRATVAPRPRRSLGLWARIAIPLAAAAAILGTVGVWNSRRAEHDTPISESPITSLSTTRPIESALERATTATIDLAREASAPAARIGRDVLTPKEPAPATEAAASDADFASAVAVDLLQSVGDRVKPISGSARHAFSFLLGPPPDSEKRNDSPQGSL